MNFVKFFMIAFFIDVVLYFGGVWYAQEAGVSNPFGVGAEFFTSIIPASGQPNPDQYSKYNPGGNVTSGSVQTSDVIGFLSLPVKLFQQILAFVGLLFSILAAPAVMLNAINTSGFLQIPTALIVAFAGVWIFGELAGLIQFFRGGTL